MLHSKRASGYYFHLRRFWDWCIALTSCLQTKKLHSEALREHCQKCLVHEGDLIMALDSEQQRGLKWTGVLKCTYCTYMSKFHNFYRVTERSEAKQGLSITHCQHRTSDQLLQMPNWMWKLLLLLHECTYTSPVNIRHAKSWKMCSDNIKWQTSLDITARSQFLRGQNNDLKVIWVKNKSVLRNFTEK